MRAALISLIGQPRDARGEPLRVAGHTLAQRQLQFALAAGCERIFAMGDGASAEAISLAHGAERAGARLHAIRDSHGLLGTVRADDALVVLAPGLLPACAAACEWLAAPAIVVAPAGAAAATGFERIDGQRAWAGALAVTGSLVERLAELPPDSEAAAALLRIALQARVRQVELPADAVAGGEWTLVRAEDGAQLDRAWVSRHLPAAQSWSLSTRAARALVAAFALHRGASAHSGTIATAAAGGTLAAGAGIAWAGWPAPGFALVAVGALLARCADGLSALASAPFGRRPVAGPRALALLIDLALAACGVGALAGSWLDRAFAPVVLIAALPLARRSRHPAAELLDDRVLLAAVLAVASALGLAKPAIMLVALAAIALALAENRATERLTPV